LLVLFRRNDDQIKWQEMTFARHVPPSIPDLHALTERCLVPLFDNKQGDVTVCIRCTICIGTKMNDSLRCKLPDKFLQIRAKAIRYLVNGIARIAEVILPDCRLRMLGAHDSTLVRGGTLWKRENLKEET
jgi:hypothetical protein